MLRYDIRIYNGATLVTTVTGLTYSATGLSVSTAYTFHRKAKDAAGNLSVKKVMLRNKPVHPQ
jgi:hypothetical protein